MNKPISPKVHGIIDYVMGGALAVLPKAIGLNSDAVKAYGGLAANFLVVDALTDTPVGLKKVMSCGTHKKADLATLGTLALMSLAKPFRQDRRALAFHIGLLALTSAQYMLTDYDKNQNCSNASWSE